MIQNTSGVRKFWTVQDHYNLVVENVTVSNLSGRGIVVINTTPKNNFAALSAPTAKDDETKGYQVGSRWINTSAGTEHVCLNPTAGRAVWKKTTL